MWKSGRKMSNETSAHKALKVIAAKKLREHGFEPDEIKAEVTVKAGDRIYIVDVAGISPDEKIAIECGKIAEPKLKRFFELQKYFDKIWHIGYGKNGEPYTFKEIDEVLKEELKHDPDEWKSIKVKANTKEKLEDMGVGIGRAVEILVEAKRQAVSDKIGDLGEITGEIADILLSSGMLDIKFKGSGIDDVSIEDDCVVIRGFIKAGIADEDAREEIYRVIKDGLERKA